MPFRIVDQAIGRVSRPIAQARRLPAYLVAWLRLVDRDIAAFLRLWHRVDPSVRGWLRAPDAYLLYRLARRGPGVGSIVEIGSAWGRSTVCLAAGSKVAQRERVTAIDPHTGDDWYLEEKGIGPIDSFAEFTKNLQAFRVDDWVQPVRMTSEAAAEAASSEPIRLLFIDGLHTYEGVSTDIRDWVPRVIPGGVVVFDDYPNPDPTVGVRRAVDELLASGLVEPRLRSAFNLTWTVRRP